MTQNRNLSILADNVSSAGVLTVAGGGTGLATTPSNGQLDIGNGTGFTRATLTAGTGITVTNGAGSISIAATLTSIPNRIINGNMYVAQRGTSATVTAGTTVPTSSTGYPCVDRWFVYSTGANVTAAQVAGATNNKNLLQVTGAASVTAVGIGQRIEQLNSYDLAGQTCTLSVNISNSLLTTVTWTASYANTADTFGTIGTPTKTQIATGTFTVTSTLTQYTANIAVPAAATTGIEILFTVGAQTSGTWQIGNAQLEVGTVATPFQWQIYSNQLAQCQRYYEKSYNNSVAVPTAVTAGTGQLFVNAISSGATVNTVNFAVSKRASPTVVSYDNGGTSGKNSYYTTGWINGGTATINTALEKGFNLTLGGTGTLVYFNADWSASAEL